MIHPSSFLNLFESEKTMLEINTSPDETSIQDPETNSNNLSFLVETVLKKVVEGQKLLTKEP